MADQQTEHDDIDAPDQETMELEARRQGWRPEEEFRGNPKTWVDAETFLERGKEIKNFTKKENEQLRRQLQDATQRLEEQGKTIEEIREYHSNMEKRAIEAAIERLKRERKQAAINGDTELAAELEEEIQELRDAPSAVPVKKADTAVEDESKSRAEAPEIKAWQKENASWYNDDEENEDLVAYANGLAAKLGGRRDLSMEERLDTLTERVKKAFPDRFGTRKRAATTIGAGEGGGREGSRKSSKSVSSLPPEARAAGERYVKQKLYKSMEEYAAEYFAQPGAQ